MMIIKRTFNSNAANRFNTNCLVSTFRTVSSFTREDFPYKFGNRTKFISADKEREADLADMTAYVNTYREEGKVDTKLLLKPGFCMAYLTIL